MIFSGVNPGEHPEFLVVGLGSPGKRYLKTRHNVGFDAVEYIDAKCMASRGLIKERHFSLTDKCVAGQFIIVMMKPQTHMCNSGMAVKDALDYYRMSPERLIVIHDDIDIEIGKFRIAKNGQAKEHSGLKSIIDHLSTDNFLRLRIGVGPKPSDYELDEFLLSKMKHDEYKLIADTFSVYKFLIIKIIDEGIDAAMDFFNRDF